MKTSVAKWGNSLAVRLPKAVSAELELNPGTQLDLVVEDDEIRLRKPKAITSAQLLAEMVAEAKRLGPEFEPETVEWGPDAGHEIVDDAYSRGEIRLGDILKGEKPKSTKRSMTRRRKIHAFRSRRHRLV
ncbi:MAG TPA: AbrB/MazE/SpoVT family DNA-binding domain-containing protein [Xanthobacteraceae bacterium]|jgi:antitoxin MazE|nr:AbrB/MazE/SpoVT family DNA-binding domain-containing protein [Xanthobacteraceae bacterium]